MVTMRLLLSLVVMLLPAADQWVWPLADPGSTITRSFDPPRSEYGPGHRGIDVPGRPGDHVLAVAGGTVTFAGQVGGVPTMTVTHGAERSTYQPVDAVVDVGTSVSAGDQIGVLGGTELNLGRLRDEEYLDPAEKLTAQPVVRLISPHGPPPSPPPVVETGDLRALGTLTSGFGWRIHPITGTRKFHDGVDFAAPCGRPVPVTAGGVVTRSGAAGGFGTYVEVKHGDGVSTGYAHLSARSVRVGDRVRAGDVIGRIGSTGHSTGCHLHYRQLVNGTAVDPLG